jgi:hypothetical protein
MNIPVNQALTLAAEYIAKGIIMAVSDPIAALLPHYNTTKIV